MTPERREIVKRVRAEGHAAAVAGKSAQTNPYPTYTADRFQWFQGYNLVYQEYAMDLELERQG